jgi:SRSO17 transposase
VDILQEGCAARLLFLELERSTQVRMRPQLGMVAVTLSVANDHASLPVAWRLYLPEARAGDPECRVKVGVPQDITFQAKPRIAPDQIRVACAAGLPRGIVLADVGYGSDTDLRSELTALGLIHAVGVLSSTTVYLLSRMNSVPLAPWKSRISSRHSSPYRAPLSRVSWTCRQATRSWERSVLSIVI